MKNLIRFTILMIGLMCACSVQAQLLWKITKKGMSQPSYIFATHHLVNTNIIDSVKGFLPAFESAKQVVGELNTTTVPTSEVRQLVKKNIYISSDTTLEMLFTKDEYARVDTCIRHNFKKITLATMNKVTPSYIQNNLEIMNYIKMGGEYNTKDHLDSYIQKKAYKEGKKIIALETYEQQASTMFGTSLRRQAELLVCFVDNLEDYIKRDIKVTEYYKKQDLQSIYKMSKQSTGTICDSTKGENESLLDNRNKAWMPKLKEYINSAPTFIAVGAAHLTGPSGLLSLMKKAGYKISAVK
jgi:uncharacterized protein YbaP (TraB family)